MAGWVQMKLIIESKQDLDFIAKKREEIGELLVGGNNPASPVSQSKLDPGMLTCTDCKKSIPSNVAEYSEKFYGQHLCRDCQTMHQRKEGD